MNILLVCNIRAEGTEHQIGGVEYHRMLKPHLALSRVFPNEYSADSFMMVPGIGEAIDDVVNQTDLVIFSREIPKEAVDYLNTKGVPFGLDLDDYWHLPEHHIAYEDYLTFDKAGVTERSIRDAHFVMCTTPIIAEKIKEFNDVVYICPNGIDTLDPVWQPNKTESKRLRFGFTGGNTHHVDLSLIASSVRKSYSDIKFYSKAQVIMVGHRAYKPEATHDGKNVKVKDEIIVEQYCENMLTDNLKALNSFPKYQSDLRNNFNSNEINAPYRRIGIIPVNEFGNVYNDIDVCVAPLVDNEFNSCKSELKMLEAGFKDCAIMLHHVRPYTLLATDKNSFDLNKKTFYEWSRILLKNPNLVADSKAQLREDIKKYDLKYLSEHRNEIYLKYKK